MSKKQTEVSGMMHRDDAAVYLVNEPSHVSTYWCMRLVRGVEEQAARKNLVLKQIDISALEEMSTPDKHPVNPVIVFGASISWFNNAHDIIRRSGMRNVIVSSGDQVFRRNTAVVSLSHRESTYDLTNYLIRAGRKKAMIFAWNPRSLNDREKLKGFIEASAAHGLSYGKDNLVIFDGSIERCITEFRECAYKYDAVICSNDTSAIALVNAAPLMGIRVPEDIYITGFGNTCAARLTEPSLTSATLDYYEAGKLAVDACLYLRKNRGVLSSFTIVKCVIFPRGSTEFREADTTGPSAQYLMRDNEETNISDSILESSFYNDRHVMNTLRLEAFLQEIDRTDAGILNALARGKTYEKLSEELNISDTMLKYRIKKMLQFSGMSTRQELLANINEYLGPAAVGKMLNELFGEHI